MSNKYLEKIAAIPSLARHLGMGRIPTGDPGRIGKLIRRSNNKVPRPAAPGAAPGAGASAAPGAAPAPNPGFMDKARSWVKANPKTAGFGAVVGLGVGAGTMGGSNQRSNQGYQ